MIPRERLPILSLLTSHWVSLLGTVLVTTAGILWLFVLSHELRGHASNPYIGIILFVALPILFIAGLILIPIGIFLARRRLGHGPALYDRGIAARRLAAFLIPTTALNLIIGAHLAYRGVEHMETESFCGQTCHVMKPHFTAHRDSPHSRVLCVECHVAPGAKGWVEAKTAGTRQLIEVAFDSYPRPVPSAIETNRLVPASETCEHCHAADRRVGSKLRVITSFADDEKNTATKTVMMLKVGGAGTGGIHGAHFGPGVSVRFAPSDAKRQTIPWIEYNDTNRKISRVYTSDPKNVDNLVKYEMQCTDCHNRPTHVFELAERAVNKAILSGELPVTLPFIRKQAVASLKTDYSTSAEASTRIPESLNAYYKQSYPQMAASRPAEIKRAGEVLVAIYNRNVFPDLKVTWGTYANNLGHTDFPGCFRCHDGAHTSPDQNSISQDCAVCHEMLAVDEPDPEILKTLGLSEQTSPPAVNLQASK